MSVALPALKALPLRSIDLSWPVLALFAAILCMLIVLPMFWLFYYSLVDSTGRFTLENFRTLVTEPVFLEPLLVTLLISCVSSLASDTPPARQVSPRQSKVAPIIGPSRGCNRPRFPSSSRWVAIR